MGFRFRKSIGVGPFRINFSKSGVGYSVGGKGYRYTKKAGGGSRTTANIPGTGISYTKDSKANMKKKSSTGSKKGTGCCGPIIGILCFLMLVGSCGDGSGTTPETEPNEIISEVATDETYDESTTDLQTEGPTNSTEDPTGDPYTQPTTEPTTEPATEPTAEPTTEPTEETAPQLTYILNTNTHKFHKPSCSSADDIKPGNRAEYTGTREEVIKRGYDPCSRCKP